MAEGHEWIVTAVTSSATDTDGIERVPAELGGTDVGGMTVGDVHYVVISDSDNRAVWMRDAATVKGVKRCIATTP